MISVITCPRPGGIKYLYPLLDAVNKQCPHSTRLLLCDGINESWEGWQSESIVLLEKIDPRDNKHVGWKAIEAATKLGEDLLFLEDDVFPVDDSSVIDALAHNVPEVCGFTSFHRSRRTSPGIHAATDFWMSQAVKIPYRSMTHLLSWRKTCSGDWEAIGGFDTALAVAGGAARWKYEQTVRNYFWHVGAVSAVINGPDGRSLVF